MKAVILSLCGILPLCPVSAAQVPDTLSQTIWNPSQGPQAREFQGAAVALEGSLLAVVAPGADFERSDEGAIRIYDLAGTTPDEPLAVLRNPEASGTLGEFVAICGRKVVFQVSSRAYSPGRLLVFDPEVPLVVPVGPALRAEADQVSVSGSRIAWKVSGERRIVVFDLESATPDEPVFDLSHSTLLEVSALTLGGDLIAVGFETAGPATGARPGLVRLFDLTSENPEVPAAEIANPLPGVERFGRSLALKGDQLAVAAGEASDPGAVHEFRLSGVEAVLARTLPGPEGSRAFGSALAYSDRGLLIASATGPAWFAVQNKEPVIFTNLPVRSLAVSGNRLAAGVPREASGLGSGLTAIFDLSAAAPAEARRLSTPAPANLNGFGQVLAVESGLLAVGAPSDHEANPFSGSVTLYQFPGGAMAARLFEPDAKARAYFGIALDLDGRWLVAGAAGLERIYVYDRTTLSSPPVVIENPDGKDAGSGFGSSLSISEDRLVAGAPEAGAGKAYVYALAENRATLIRTTINPGRGTGFGVSVKLSGNRLLVSTRIASETWVYDLSDADPLLPRSTAEQPDAQLGRPGLLLEGDWAVTAGTRRLAPSGARLMIFSEASRSPRSLLFRNFITAPEAHEISGLALDGNLLAFSTDSVRFFDLDAIDTVPLPQIGEASASGALAFASGVLAVGNSAKSGNGQASLGAVDIFVPGPRLTVRLGPTPESPELKVGPREMVWFRAPQGESLQRTFTLQNTGSEMLTLSFGTLPAGFSFVSRPRSLAPGSSEPLVLRFEGNESSSGDLVIESNDFDNTPLAFQIVGIVVLEGADADRDGLSDTVEIGLEPLGFNWRQAQPELVSVLSNFAFSGGLVTLEQLRGMEVGTVLTRDGSGGFRLVLDLRRSPNLRDFNDFPLHPADVSITEEGDLDIRIEDDAEAAFFLFEAR